MATEIWKFNEDQGRIESEKGRIIAFMARGDSAQSRKNGKFIAAAPELAEALKETLKAVHQLMPGLIHIAAQDYANINEAPIRAAAALRKAGLID